VLVPTRPQVWLAEQRHSDTTQVPAWQIEPFVQEPQGWAQIGSRPQFRPPHWGWQVQMPAMQMYAEP
jgi:hypothetical protein